MWTGHEKYSSTIYFVGKCPRKKLIGRTKLRWKSNVLLKWILRKQRVKVLISELVQDGVNGWFFEQDDTRRCSIMERISKPE
jgi:hypothetical protein